MMDDRTFLDQAALIAFGQLLKMDPSRDDEELAAEAFRYAVAMMSARRALYDGVDLMNTKEMAEA